MRTMRKWLLVALAAGLSLSGRAQMANLSWDFGGGFSAVGYTGDYNMSPIPRTISGSGSLLVRYNTSSMYAWRMEAGVGGIAGKFDPSRGYLPFAGQDVQTKFHNPFISLMVSAEVNLYTFQVNDFVGSSGHYNYIAPYVTLGVGGGYIFAHGGGFLVPLGGGVKFAFSKRLTIAPELRFVRYFSERVDGYTSWPLGRDRSFWHNHDWVSMLSVTCTYRVILSGSSCPAYYGI